MKVAVLQLTSVLDYRQNLSVIREYLQEAKTQKAVAAFLPECFYSMSDGLKPTPHLVSRGNEHENNILSLACDNNICLFGGSVAFRGDDSKIYNRAYNIDSSGNIISTYDKINLFSCNLYKNGKQTREIREDLIYSPGNQVSSFDYSGVTIGNTICFDIRFPGLFNDLISKGVDIITIPSAFTRKTGALHWHTLNKARAIETQSFVISAAQVGDNGNQVTTFGHSLVVDPWGEVILDLGGKKSSVGIANLNFDKIVSVRNSIKVR